MATDGSCGYVVNLQICKKNMMVHDISRRKRAGCPGDDRHPGYRGVHLGGDGRVQILKFMFLLLHLGTWGPPAAGQLWLKGPE